LPPTQGCVGVDPNTDHHDCRLPDAFGASFEPAGDLPDEDDIGLKDGTFTDDGTTYNALMGAQNFARSGGTRGPLVTGVVGDAFVADFEPRKARKKTAKLALPPSPFASFACFVVKKEIVPCAPEGLPRHRASAGLLSMTRISEGPFFRQLPP
jgi:hypothetical protein